MQFFLLGQVGRDGEGIRGCGRAGIREALLVVLWPEEYVEAPRSELKEEFHETLVGDLLVADTPQKKDELMFDMYLKLNKDGDFRNEVERYAASAFGQMEVTNERVDNDSDNPSSLVSSITPIWYFPLLYEWACHLI